jgi:hypothetical protein
MITLSSSTSKPANYPILPPELSAASESLLYRDVLLSGTGVPISTAPPLHERLIGMMRVFQDEGDVGKDE